MICFHIQNIHRSLIADEETLKEMSRDLFMLHLILFRSWFCFHIQNIHHSLFADEETFKEMSRDLLMLHSIYFDHGLVVILNTFHSTFEPLTQPIDLLSNINGVVTLKLYKKFEATSGPRIRITNQQITETFTIIQSRFSPSKKNTNQLLCLDLTIF